MTELFWPGDRRADPHLSDEALVAAMVRVEAAWLGALQAAGVATDVEPLPPVSVGDLVDGCEAGGNPVIPLVAVLRSRLGEPTRTWLHRGLTSQDVLDTALLLCARDAVDQMMTDLRRQVIALRDLAGAHRSAVKAAHTLTQHAVPTTFGLTAANWLAGVLDAAADLAAVRFRLPVQFGGAAGTLSAVAALGVDPIAAGESLARGLGLAGAAPWHTNRRPITRLADALAACVAANGRIANDVLVHARPEIGELAEGTPGGSSTMPHKRNPVLSVLVKRAAIAAPFSLGQLSAAAGAAVDERPDGAWHVEWAALRTLGRLTVVAVSQTADLLEGLVVHTDRMRATALAAAAQLLAEQRAIQDDAGSLESYLGATARLIDEAIARADRFLEVEP